MAFQLAVGNNGDLWIIDDEEETVLQFEDIDLTMEDVFQAIQKADGVCMDECDDQHNLMQILLDIISEKDDSQDTDTDQ